MSHLKTHLFLAVFFCLLSNLNAQEQSVGLYYPDFRAVRTLFQPGGTMNLPDGSERDTIVEAWNKISQPGRQLLLQERDLVVLVVTSEGRWLYRSQGIHTLRLLSQEASEDAENLLTILTHAWFGTLRDFYSRTLFQSSLSAAPVNYGSMLTGLESRLPESTPEQRDWFRTIVGEEIIDTADPRLRTVLLSDPTHGESLRGAVALARKSKESRLKSLSVAVQSDPGEFIDLGELGLSDRHAGYDVTVLRQMDVQSVEGAKFLEWNTTDGTVFLELPEDGIPAGDLSPKKLEQLIRDRKTKAFLGTPGTDKVFELR